VDCTDVYKMICLLIRLTKLLFKVDEVMVDYDGTSCPYAMEDGVVISKLRTVRVAFSPEPLLLA
jgi:hypothetical protein